MKTKVKIALSLLLVVLSVSKTSAATFPIRDPVTGQVVIMGTICSNGVIFTNYPPAMAQPLGTACPIRDNFGNVIGQGTVTG